MYNPDAYIHEKDIVLSDSLKAQLQEASQSYLAHFDGSIWYGRCIFFSWYCKKATCKFCFRATVKHKQRHKPLSRSIGSMLLEALFCKVFNWRIEFLTGGYQEDDEHEHIVEYAKLVSQVYGEKIWVNIGHIDPEYLEKLRPYIEGVCASIETPTPRIHEFVCPDKPLLPYEQMFEKLQGLKKSACFIVGLGDTHEDFTYWKSFIERHKLDRITVYALKPVRGSPFTSGPTTEEYLWWLSKLRITFPKLEIIGGTNLRRSEEVGHMIQAGVNAITKFPATKQFGTKKAQIISEQVQQQRTFISELQKVPDIDWHAKIDELSIEQVYKDEMKEKLGAYIHTFLNPRDADPLYESGHI